LRAGEAKEKEFSRKLQRITDERIRKQTRFSIPSKNLRPMNWLRALEQKIRQQSVGRNAREREKRKQEVRIHSGKQSNFKHKIPRTAELQNTPCQNSMVIDGQCKARCWVVGKCSSERFLTDGNPMDGQPKSKDQNASNQGDIDGRK
jgi:hypothetical protein